MGVEAKTCSTLATHPFSDVIFLTFEQVCPRSIQKKILIISHNIIIKVILYVQNLHIFISNVVPQWTQTFSKSAKFADFEQVFATG